MDFMVWSTEIVRDVFQDTVFVIFPTFFWNHKTFPSKRNVWNVKFSKRG